MRPPHQLRVAISAVTDEPLSGKNATEHAANAVALLTTAIIRKMESTIGDDNDRFVAGIFVFVFSDYFTTQTYLVAGPLSSKREAKTVESYLRTRFARFLVSLRKPSQDVFRSMYRWVPVQPWGRTWTDADLYKKYGITKDEQAFIESMIRPMAENDE